LDRSFEWASDPSMKLSSYASCFENEDEIKLPKYQIKKSKEYEVAEPNESISMEAEYQDIMSLEIDEGASEISLQKIDTRQNILSSLTPDSANLSPGDQSSPK
jgi:hypothetical protein